MRRVLQVLGPSTGGIRVHVAALAHHLELSGIESPVLAPEGVMAGLGPQAGVVEVPSTVSATALRKARRQLRPWRSGSDLIHAHGLKAGWTCVHGPPKRPLVLTVHNVVLDESAGRTASLRRRLERQVLRRADRVIAPTAAIAEGLAGVVPADRLDVIVPASPVPVLRRTGADLRAQRRIPAAAPLVVCVARLHPQKDLPMLLRAWSTVLGAVPTAHLVVVGEGPLRGAIEAMCGDLALGGSVDLVGFDDHAVDWIAAGDVVAITSVWEAIPLVLAEAMQLGVPVISTAVGLAGELLGDGAAGVVVDVGDAAGLGAALIGLLQDEERRRDAGRAAAERASSRFDPSALSEAVAAVYEEVVMNSGGRR